MNQSRTQWLPILLEFGALGLGLGVALMLVFNAAYWLIDAIWIYARDVVSNVWFTVAIPVVCGAILTGILSFYRASTRKPLPIQLTEYFLPFAAGAPTGIAMGIFQFIRKGCAWIKARIISRCVHRHLIDSDQDLSKRQKIVCYAYAIVCAAVGVAFVIALTGVGMTVPQVSVAQFSPEMIVPTLALSLLGWLLGLVYLGASKKFSVIWENATRMCIYLPLLVGACLGIALIFLPHVGFPGSDAISSGLISEYQQMSPAILIATAIFRVVFIAAFLHLGWKGGPLFPLVFSAMCLGFGIAGATSGDANVYATAAICGMLVSFSGKPVMALFALLCCPVENLPIMVIATALAALLRHPKHLQGEFPAKK